MTRAPTHITLPQGDREFKDGGDVTRTVRTFLGKTDLTSYTQEQFLVVHALTGQMVIGDLVMSSYGQIDTTISYETKDSILRNNILGMFNTYLQDELFDSLCPGLTQNPSDALNRVAQVVKEGLHGQ